MVEDAVDAAREREDVLWLERRDERRAQRREQLALGASPRCSASRTPLRRGRLPAAQRRERVERFDRHRDLAAQQPEHVGRLGQEPVARLSRQPPPEPESAAASTAVAGIVINHARPIWRTIAQCT